MNQIRFCEHCGATLDADARFCDTCGTPVELTNQSAPPSPGAATPVAQPAPAVLTRSVDRRVLVLAVAGVIVLLVCTAIGVLGFLFWQSNPSVISQPPGGAPQVSVVPTLRLPTNVAPAIATTVRPPTPVPPATSATSLPAGTLFYDDFASQDVSKRNGWFFGSDEIADEKWSPNQFLISIKEKNRSLNNRPSGQYQNFAIETEAEMIQGESASYGLVFRSTQSEGKYTYYYFTMDTHGFYTVWRFVNGKTMEPALIPLQASQFINPGKAKNVLGVTVEGSTLSFYINRVRVNTVTDDTIQGPGQVGVSVAGFSDFVTVAISRFAVYTPEKAKAEWVGGLLPSPLPTGSNLPQPTLVPPTSTAPPGLYVTGVRLEPGPKRSVEIGFYPQFSNTTGGTQTYRVRVYLFRPDNPRNSFGETSAALITIPVGSSEQKALGSWKLGGGGGCEDFLVRVGWIDPDNRITFFNKPDGAIFEYFTPICP